MTMAMRACERGDVDELGRLIAAGADLNIKGQVCEWMQAGVYLAAV